ncbi:MAG: hypothetical protein MJZ27_00110 [Bacteroidales bacterium]|nr:hypothetical protein [Bacteroidales bacterium]
MKSRMVLFLTSCINPQGMSYTVLQDIDERLRQYKNALQWYLENTDFRILFVENSNYDISPLFKEYIDNGRLEVLFFDGNNYDKSLGKGYGEALIIERGIRDSRIIQPDSTIIKVTGRLIAHGINRIVSSVNLNGKRVYADWIQDLQSKDVIAGSQMIVAHVQFFKEYFLPKISMLNDSNGYYFEHLLRDAIGNWKRDGHQFKEFPFSPQFEGVGGTRGDEFRPSMKNEFVHVVRRYILHPLGYYGTIDLGRAWHCNNK